MNTVLISNSSNNNSKKNNISNSNNNQIATIYNKSKDHPKIDFNDPPTNNSDHPTTNNNSVNHQQIDNSIKIIRIITVTLTNHQMFILDFIKVDNKKNNKNINNNKTLMIIPSVIINQIIIKMMILILEATVPVSLNSLWAASPEDKLEKYPEKKINEIHI